MTLPIANLSYFTENYDTLTYDEYAKGLQYCLDIIRQYQDPLSVRQELSQLRVTYNENQLSFLENKKVFKVETPHNLTKDQSDLLHTYGFYTKDTDHYLLSNRFIIEVRDASGRLITIIGWYPDQRKYITIATRYFSKNIDWFNIDQAFDQSYYEFDRTLFVVEGIFDALSLASLGLPAVATMGANVGTIKGKTLTLFDKIIAIPDGDEVGLNAIKRWVLPLNTTKVRINLALDLPIQHEDGTTTVKHTKIKDIDELISLLNPISVRQNLVGLMQSNNVLEVID